MGKLPVICYLVPDNWKVALDLRGFRGPRSCSGRLFQHAGVSEEELEWQDRQQRPVWGRSAENRRIDPNQPINREFAPALSHLRPSNIDQAHPGE